MKTLTLLLASILTVTAAGMEPIELSEEAVERLELRVEPIVARPIADPVRVTGRLIIDPNATEIVSACINARIDEDKLRVGDAVKVGQVILKLRSREVAAAVTTYLKSELDLRSSRAVYEREKQLAEKKLTTEEALQKADAAYQQARIAHLTAIQPMHRMGFDEVELHRMVDEGLVRKDLTYFQVKSPLDGVIIDKETVPGATIDSGQNLMTVANLDHLLVEMRVPLRGVGRIRKGIEIQFKTTAGSERSGMATLLGMAASAGTETVAATALALVDNKKREWIAGTPVEVQLADPKAPSLPAVPAGAVVEINGKAHVFLEEKSGVFRPMEVEVIERSSHWIGLGNPARENQRIVVSGASLLLAAWESKDE
jgi:cobalt-zinc-cadmium efflux system membrane fusion protein